MEKVKLVEAGTWYSRDGFVDELVLDLGGVAKGSESIVIEKSVYR